MFPDRGERQSSRRRRSVPEGGSWLNGVFVACLFLLPACYNPTLEGACEQHPDTCTIISADDPQLPGFIRLREPNSYECHCECGIDTDGDGTLDPAEVQIQHELQVCMLEEHNRNLGGDYSPSDLTNDCRERVRRNLQAISRECVAGDTATDYICKNCEALAVTTPVAACNRDLDPATPEQEQCEAEPLQVDPLTKECTNFNPEAGDFFKTATHHPDLEALGPVCLADRSDPPVPTPSALAAGIFGRTTRCDVTGTAELNADGLRRPPADGVVYFTGEPCTGPSCDIGMFFKLHVQDFEVKGGGSLFGVDFDVVKGSFKEMQGWGSSVAGGATLTPSGAGRFAGRFDAGELLSTGRGVVDKCVFDDVITDSCIFDLGSNRDTVLARNDGPLEITAAWAGDRTCSLDGTVSTLGDGFGVHLAGHIVNQPPRANAGSDHTLECTSSAGGIITLDGSASSDPDANITLFSWRRGGRAGEQVALESIVDVDLAVGETQAYVLTVVDGFGQASHDTVVVGVNDTVAPSIACNLPDPATITPNDGIDEDNPTKPPIAFTATATDTCDPTANARIISFDCFAYTRGGKKIDKKGECALAIDGATITILNSGGVDTHIQWIVRGADHSGNAEHKACEVLVVKP